MSWTAADFIGGTAGAVADERGGMVSGDDNQAALDAFEQAGAIVIAFEGPDFTIVAANRAARQAIGGRSAVGRLYSDALPAMAEPRWAERLHLAYAYGQGLPGLALHQAYVEPSGEEATLDFEVALSPWRDATGATRGVIATGLQVAPQTIDLASSAVEPPRLAHFTPGQTNVLAVQTALSPLEVPVLPGLSIAARYLLAEDESAAGGDWYDAIGRLDGPVTLVVGDVVGHGVSGSAAMGQLRALLLDRVELGLAPVEALQSLERWALHHPEARGSTICVVQLDPSTGALTYCTAGHPPPLLLPAGQGEARYLRPSGAGPLGTGTVSAPGQDRLLPGEVIVLYTNGIIERPGRSAVNSTVELQEVALSVARSVQPGPALVDAVCDRAIDRLTARSGYDDDITIMAVQRVATLPPLHLKMVAHLGAPASARRALAEWLAPTGADPSDVNALAQALTELVTNVIDHAYTPRRPGPVEIDGHLRPDGALELTVTDQGRWRDGNRRPSGGLGLNLLRALLDEVEVTHGPQGTSVRVCTALHRPARLYTDGRYRQRGPMEPSSIEVRPGEGTTLAVRGALDMTSTPRLSTELARVVERGANDVVIDLSQVTLLATAAVYALHQALRSTAAAGVALQFYAPWGSAAQHVLALSALPYSTTQGPGPSREPR